MPLYMNSQKIYNPDTLETFVNFKEDKSQKELKTLCNSLQEHHKVKNSYSDVRLNNALGAEINITNLTYVRQRVVTQKFYEIKPSDYLPVVVGEGAFMTHTVNYRAYLVGSGGFEESLMDVGADSPKQPRSRYAIDSLTIPHKQYLRGYEYSIFEMNQLSQMQFGKSPIELLEESRKKDWDLGIQKTAFLGLSTDPNVTGLLNQSNITTDNTILTTPISQLDADGFLDFVGSLLPRFFNNSNSTAMPTDLYIAPFDYLSLGRAVSPVAPFNSRLQYLNAMMQELTGNPNFKVKMLLYCDQDVNGLGFNRYIMMRRDEDVARMSIPIDYTTTVVDTFNGFNWQGGAYGQFTGVIVNRPLEIYYMDYVYSNKAHS